MSYDILINNLLNGEPVTKTNADGVSFTEMRPPTRNAIAAAKALQNLQGQLNFGTAAINQLTKERNEMWEILEKTQQQNQKLQNEIKSLQSTEISQ
jgi:translation initiation factor 2B subunit (eIF-2B alpha/beta/delta family)